MRFTRTRKRASAAALAVVAMGVIGVGSATSAQAAEGSWQIRSGGCVALELVELQGGHDHMAIDPTAAPTGCEFGIQNVGTGQWIYGPTTDPRESGWYYDGPGTSLQACTWGPRSAEVCGPVN
ncbi:hypothetical protein OG500_32515 [Kitasatospora sp. NBC_01250]|uniref:hypothetical protein n=1 Tax=unclassified Kitasatospora TaxID=2633591 RepID=UPI002E0EAB5F|nr:MULTISPECIES: hypothetical protein [unclassified Kitasatospora]WSJ70712.1 hypothetical protein OG294_34050 [Kitasatospora sp. NBC_01302]